MSGKSLPITYEGRGCAIFRCLRRQGYYCCADCRERDVCRRDCHNDPERCGLVRERVPRKKDVEEFARERGQRENRDGPGA